MDPQQRIITHMNKDHALSLEDYLESYGSIKITPLINNIKMESISLDHLTLAYTDESKPQRVKIPIEPPMTDFSEARVKLVEMAKEAATKRGFSVYQINQFDPPKKPLHIILLSLTLCLCASALNNQLLFTVLETGFGISHETSTTVAAYLPSILKLIGSIHIVEFLFILKPKLDKYRVPPHIRLVYTVSCLFEGFATLQRFNAKANGLENPKKE
ncbi:unnamed protein product [Ambrosiozyma monospora]|uniref:Unnamed protein product n=1 Tax=Ambrosiozyma monospora TaxID=43982 RepID=A0ACB5T3P4_AMBMO|nr:unnamed protein product [Ambrosiozyma monospora]